MEMGGIAAMGECETTVPVVYTWVDDSWDGYLDLRDSYAATRHDRNPNRTRDNLDILKYSLRTLALYAPWAKPVVIVSMRPQVPVWLNRDHPEVRVVHHDEFIPADCLPTFNSLAIVAHLHRIPGIGPRFLYMEDDMLLGAPVVPADLIAPGGVPRLWARPFPVPPDLPLGDDRLSPWTRAVSHTNRRLDARFGAKPRPHVGRVPILVRTEVFAEMWQAFAAELAATAKSRFRSAANLAPEHLYPHFALETGRAVLEPVRAMYRVSAYYGAENNPWLNRLGFAWLKLFRRRFLCLNDNFDDDPAPAVVAGARRLLQGLAPHPGPYERL
jgi:hypothetical protein